MPRCHDCSRPVSVRWQRCRKCRAVQRWPQGTAALLGGYTVLLLVAHLLLPLFALAWHAALGLWVVGRL